MTWSVIIWTVYSRPVCHWDDDDLFEAGWDDGLCKGQIKDVIKIQPSHFMFLYNQCLGACSGGGGICVEVEFSLQNLSASETGLLQLGVMLPL